MTAEGVFPKVAGDISYASEANMFSGYRNYAYGLIGSLSTSGTGNAFIWNNGSYASMTDEEDTTFFAGSSITADQKSNTITVTLPNSMYYREVLFAGSFSMTGGDAGARLVVNGTNIGNLNANYSQRIPITSIAKQSDISINIATTLGGGNAGSVAFKIFTLGII